MAKCLLPRSTGPSEVRAHVSPSIFLGRGERGLWNVGLVSLHQTGSPLRLWSWRNKRVRSIQTPPLPPGSPVPSGPAWILPAGCHSQGARSSGWDLGEVLSTACPSL